MNLKKKKEYEWPGRGAISMPSARDFVGATGLAAALWAGTLEGLRPPRSTCTPLLTWAAVVRISIYTFQEGDTR